MENGNGTLPGNHHRHQWAPRYSRLYMPWPPGVSPPLFQSSLVAEDGTLQEDILNDFTY